MQPSLLQEMHSNPSFTDHDVEIVDLQAPRGSDRRTPASAEPPWITEEGFVMEDRRAGMDRRSKA